MKERIVKHDLLFHSAHGLCRVAGIIRSAQSKELSYSLLPISSNEGKVRFIIPDSSFEDSGFSKLITVKEANAILEYFKTGHKKDSEYGQAWTLAMMIWSESCGKDSVKDARKRQRLARSVKGLADELAFVLKMTAREIAERIQTHLGAISNINPVVLAALANVGKD
jgi:RNA polymerase-interacting CarD/CdnL/TRCF family regulator